MKSISFILTILFAFNASLLSAQQTENMEKKKVTDGRDYLGDFAPKFAEINDDVLFGQIWSREKELSARERSLITISALMASGITDQSLKGHLQKAKENGVTRKEIAEVITHLAFYTGWPKGWAVFALAMEVFKDEATATPTNILFGLGDLNEAYAKYFVGRSYVKSLVTPSEANPMYMDNVTFEPSGRNKWHLHTSEQILLVTEGTGWYQEEGKAAQVLSPGDVVVIKPNIKHWHGAAKDGWFTHISISTDVMKAKTEWFDALSDEEYNRL